MSEDVIERLDRISAILSLAFAEQIDTARDRIREDKVAAAVLDATEDWLPAGVLKTTVASATNVSARTVVRKVGELVHLGALKPRGSGPTVAYRNTGLV